MHLTDVNSHICMILKSERPDPGTRTPRSPFVEIFLAGPSVIFQLLPHHHRVAALSHKFFDSLQLLSPRLYSSIVIPPSSQSDSSTHNDTMASDGKTYALSESHKEVCDAALVNNGCQWTNTDRLAAPGEVSG